MPATRGNQGDVAKITVSQDTAKVKLTPAQKRRIRRKKLAAFYKDNIAEACLNVVSNVPHGRRPGHFYYPYGIQGVASECLSKPAKKALDNELSDKDSAIPDAVVNQNNFFVSNQGVTTQKSSISILGNRSTQIENSQNRRPWHTYYSYDSVQAVPVEQNEPEKEVSSNGLKDALLSKRNCNNGHNKWRDIKDWVEQQVKENALPENHPPQALVLQK